MLKGNNKKQQPKIHFEKNISKQLRCQLCVTLNTHVYMLLLCVFIALLTCSSSLTHWEFLEVKSCSIIQLWSLAQCPGCDLLPAFLFSRLSCCQRQFPPILISLCVFPSQKYNIHYKLDMWGSISSVFSIQTREFLLYDFFPLMCSPTPLVWWFYFLDLQTLPLTSTYSLYDLCHIISYFCAVSLSSDNMSNAVCDMYCVAPCSRWQRLILTPPGIPLSCVQGDFGHSVSYSIIAD